jgi:asparagine synthase (glutamine-hydrolysing)
MCGIAGFLTQFANGVDEQNLWQMVSSQKHRGPDDTGIYLNSEAGIGLAHCRLAILDLSPLGHQPMVSSDGSVTLVFNGEIYNFLEIRQELLEKGFKFQGQSDTEVLLNLYLSEGKSMLSRLNGIFAFALWDSRHQILFIARDALGVKPLYYVNTPHHFAFASEIKALKPFFPATTSLDYESLHRYLTFLYCPGKGTPLKSVSKLLPGEAMTVTQGNIHRWTWYQLPVFRPHSTLATPIIPSLNSLLNSTVSHLRSAVHRQMIADVPVGAFLSGGLDSSAIVAFAREINSNICCFTIDGPNSQNEGMVDDLPYAKQVAAHLQVPLEVVKINSSQMATDLQMMVEQLDEPLADPAPLNVLYISRIAKSQGIKVLLSGTGGDDLFTGYRRHVAVQQEPYWRWLPTTIRSWLQRSSLAWNQGIPLLRRARKLLTGATLEGDSRLVNYFVWNQQADLLKLYTNEFRSAIRDQIATIPMLEFLSPLSDTGALDKMLALEQRFFLSDHNLIYTDKMSMAAGVEVRVPFLDLELVDFAAQIPVSLKQRGSIGKWILKKAMEPYLPLSVIYRSKSGFGAPLRHWMRFELRELLGDILSTESLKRRGLFEPLSVHSLIADNDSGRADASYTLLSLMCIELWCRRFVDGNPFSSSEEINKPEVK